MRVLVTGGAGFIGSHFVREVLNDTYPALTGARVTVLDKLTYAGNLANLAPVADSPRHEFVLGDICDAPLVHRLVGAADLVVHFAAESHVDRSIDASGDFVRTNVLGTDTLLTAAVAAGSVRFVHVSTDEVYGSIDEGSWPEDHPLSPNSPYSASKASSDLLALAYHRTHGVDVRVTRCSNNYGPYQHPEKAIPLFTTNLMSGLDIPLYGDGKNSRDWLYVDDHCRAVALAAEKGRPGQIYNIGGGTEMTNSELVSHILRLSGKGWDAVQRVTDRKAHDRRYSVDPRKALTELGYEPRIPFEEGIARTVRWYHDNPDWWRPLRFSRSAAQTPS
ncbi:dTDP-glucose 4,6-dehydratase [Streptomyces sp. NPDC006645]|uniref:dTDP-glucose 4,6-dehydratase n=1 Tax=unclassified Streptomyces TaxID=2593676 RepID=UPI0033AB2A72